VEKLAVGRVLRDHTERINSIDFTKDGELMLSASDTRVYLYNCQQGALERATACEAHGVAIARFTHDPLSLVTAALHGIDEHSMSYLSLHDNRYLRRFPGHTGRVTALEMSPKEDTFASVTKPRCAYDMAAADDTVRVWDLRSPGCTGVLRCSGLGKQSAISYDPHGLVLAAALCGGHVKLFDVRAYEKGPFATFSPDLQGTKDFANVSFSHDGKLMLLATAQGLVAVLDAFSGELLHALSGHENEQGVPLAGCFSPDSQYVLCGAEDGSLWRWSVQTGQALARLDGHPGPVTCVKCNPTRMLLASACSLVCLWLST